MARKNADAVTIERIRKQLAEARSDRIAAAAREESLSEALLALERLTAAVEADVEGQPRAAEVIE